MRSNDISKLARCERGAVAVEYALIAVLLATGIVGSFLALGNGVNGNFETIDSQVRSASD